MALDFPSSPSNGQIYTANSRSWVWDGTANAWVGMSSAAQAPSYCRVYLTSNSANLVNATWTAVAFDAESSDADGMHAASNSRITIQKSGTYNLSAFCYMYQHADMGAYLTAMAIRVNGSAGTSGETWESWRVPAQVAGVPMAFNATQYLNAGDYVEMWAYSTYLGKIFSNSSIQTWLSVASTGLTGATGPAGPDTPYGAVVEVTGTSTQNVHNLSINSNTALVNFTSIHASNNYITGITGGAAGRRLTLRNGTSNTSLYLLIQTENSSSDANNRFYAHRFSPCELGNGRSVDLLWVNNYNRWVITQTSFG